MTKVSQFMRKLFHKDTNLHLKLRKAVTCGKVRQVATLLDEGANPIWMEDDFNSSSSRFRSRNLTFCQLNSLLLACQYGNEQILCLFLDTFFTQPQVLQHFSRAMYCLVIRHNNWKLFQMLQQRQIPISENSTKSPSSIIASENSSSKLPLPIFVAAEHGRPHILSYLLAHYPQNWGEYTFEGNSLLTVATINGHYECVRILLEQQVATGRSMDDAVVLARRHRQAHVLVLLTNYFPEFEPEFESFSPPTGSQSMEWSNQVKRTRDRVSIAETVSSELDEETRRSSLLAMSSPINYNLEDLNRVEEMRQRAEVEKEQRESGISWFVDARDNEEEAWYAVKPKDNNREYETLLQCEEEDEKSYETMFSVQEEANQQFSPLSNERNPSISAPRSSSSMVRSGRSHKVISVRSRSVHQHRLLAAIEEHPLGEKE